MTVEIGDFGGHPLRRWKRFILKSKWLHNALMVILSYSGWVLLVHFFSLTFITYFLSTPSARFQDINDVFYSNQVSIMGLGSLAFVLLLWSLHPVTSVEGSDIFRRDRFEKFFVSGFLKGATYSGLLLLCFILFGLYRCLGYFIQISAVPLDLANVAFRILALATLAYCEEFLFHSKIFSYFNGNLPIWLAAQIIAISYCGIKRLQFDLNLAHLFTLYLLSLNLFYRAQKDDQFESGAGYWAACLIVFHPIASLPVFGNEFSGTLIVKPSEEPTLASLTWITGGPNGPLASLIFQLLLLLDLVRSMLRNRRSSVVKIV